MNYDAYQWSAREKAWVGPNGRIKKYGKKFQPYLVPGQDHEGYAFYDSFEEAVICLEGDPGVDIEHFDPEDLEGVTLISDGISI